MLRMTRALVFAGLLLNAWTAAWADGDGWEYRVVLMQGITTGGSLAKQADGVYVDTTKTTLLNELAADGWEVIEVIGAPAGDHTVYLRRQGIK